MNIVLNKVQVFLLMLALFVVLSLLGYRYLSVRANAETYVDGVLACYPEDNPEMDEEAIEAALAAELTILEDRMLQSASVEAQVVATAAFAPRQARLERLQALSIEHPDNTLAALHALSACLADISLPGCGPEVASAVAELDGTNGFAWTLVARYRSLQNDEYGTLAALRQANAAPGYDSYLGEQLAVAVQAMSQQEGVLANSVRWLFVTHLFDARLSTHHTIPSRYCLPPESLSPGLAEQCLAVAERMVGEGDTRIDQSLGLSIQEAIHAASGNTAEAEAIAVEREVLNTGGSRARGLAVQLSMFDTELNRYWLENLIDAGEQPALDRLVERAREKSADPDYSPCSPPGIRFDFPFFYSGPDRIIY